MERVAARYAERIQHNLDHVAREREAFLAWQAKKNEEIQRITEAVSLCGKQPVVEPAAETSGAFAKAAAATTSSTAPQNGKAEIEKPS